MNDLKNKIIITTATILTAATLLIELIYDKTKETYENLRSSKL